MYLRPYISQESFDRKHAHALKRYMVLIARVDSISYGTVLLQCGFKPRVERAAGVKLKFGRKKQSKQSRTTYFCTNNMQKNEQNV